MRYVMLLIEIVKSLLQLSNTGEEFLPNKATHVVNIFSLLGHFNCCLLRVHVRDDKGIGFKDYCTPVSIVPSRLPLFFIFTYYTNSSN